MKVLVMSDTHKDLTKARIAIRHTMKESLDGVIHCGDHIEDAKKLEEEFPNLKFYYVPGNCDGWFFKEDERIKLIRMGDKKILITHGDRHDIKSSYRALFQEMKNRGADIGVCGHSHIAHTESQEAGGLMVVNPGSISLPRDSDHPSYSVLDLQKDKKIELKMMRIVGKEPIENPQ